MNFRNYCLSYIEFLYRHTKKNCDEYLTQELSISCQELILLKNEIKEATSTREKRDFFYWLAFQELKNTRNFVVFKDHITKELNKKNIQKLLF